MGHLLGGELEALLVRHPLRGDGIFRTPRVDAGDPECLATGTEFPRKITRRQAEGFGERLEPKLLRVQRAPIRKRDGHPERNVEPPAQINVAQALVVAGQAMPFGDLAASLQHVALDALAKSGGQVSGWVLFRHALIKLQKGDRPASGAGCGHGLLNPNGLQHAIGIEGQGAAPEWRLEHMVHDLALAPFLRLDQQPGPFERTQDAR